MVDTSTDRKTLGALIVAPLRFILRLFTMAGGLAIRALMIHEGRWPSVVSGTGLGLLAVGLMSCAAPRVTAADWYQRCSGVEIFHTGWLTETAYLKAAADQRASGCYPLSLKAEAVTDGEPSRHYRATFKPHPDNIADWRTSLALDPAADAKLDAMLIAQGYTRIWQDDLTDSSGAHFVQGIWTKAD
jgi:hypothetical protein